jgi:hypothetical protein
VSTLGKDLVEISYGSCLNLKWMDGKCDSWTSGCGKLSTWHGMAFPKGVVRGRAKRCQTGLAPALLPRYEEVDEVEDVEKGQEKRDAYRLNFAWD